MFRSATTVEMLKPIALIAGLAILLWSLGLPSLRFANAASVTSFSDVLSDSAPSAASNHTITFTTTDGLAAGETMTLDFTGFGGSVAFGDVDLTVGAAPQTLAGSASSGVWGVTYAGNVLTFTSNDTTIATGTTVTILIGTNASGGTGQLTNPAAEGSYPIALAGTMSDSGETRVVILTAVQVSASVNTIFDFTVTGTNAGTLINTQTSNATTSSTTVPFGTLTALNARTGAHQLEVSTNAKNGYVVTVQVDQPFQSSTGAIIDGFNSDSDTPTAWTQPTAPDIGDATTWGYWGITSDDTTIASRGTQFADNLFIAASTTAREVMSHTGPVAGAGVGQGTTTVGYRVEISALQEAADDYTTTLTYVATPTF